MKFDKKLLMKYDEVMALLSQFAYASDKKKKLERGQIKMSEFDQRLMYSSLYESSRMLYEEIESWRFIKDMERKEMEHHQLMLRNQAMKNRRR